MGAHSQGGSRQSGRGRVVDPWAIPLFRVAKSRDRVEYQKIFNHFAPLVKAYILRNLSTDIDRSHSDEIAQEVMIKVWNKSPSFNAEKANVNTWIFAIARNSRIDFLRKKNRAGNTVAVEDIWLEDDTDSPLLNLQRHRAESVVKNALADLPEEQNQALVMAFVEGKSHTEVAAALGLPLGTVKSRIRLALNKMKLLIDR